jgi:hypothetical protein
MAQTKITGDVIADGTITSAKFASGAIAGIANGAVTTLKIADDAVTTDKLANSINTAITANTAKVTNAITTHTGDVTGGAALTIANDAVTTDHLANSINSAITANTAKVTNATHTGDVTGGAALTIAANAVNITKLDVTDGSSGQVLSTDGSGTLSFITSGGLYNAWLVKTAAYTALSGDQLILNHASTAFTITLPLNPSVGDTVILHNAGGVTVTIARNSQKINSIADDAVIQPDSSTQLVWVSAAIGWKEV